MIIKDYLSKTFRVIALYPTRAIIVAIIITFFLSVTSGWNAWVSYRDFNQIFTQEFRLKSLSDETIYLDEVLTMSARLNAATGDNQWEKRYLDFEPKLDAVIKEIIAIAPEAYEGEGAKQTDIANIKLVKMEKESFELVRQGRKEEALKLLSSDAYNSQKQVYTQSNQISSIAVQNRIKQRLLSYQQEFLRTELLTLLSLIIIIPLWIVILQIVKRALRDRKALQDILQRSEERTRATLFALPDLVFRVNRDGEYMDFLTSYQGENLADPNQAIGNSIYDPLPATIITPHAETKYSALQQAFATQTVQIYEQQVWIENKLRYEEVRIAPCGNDEVVFFIRDISDRKQAEKLLQESQQFIQTVVDTVPLPLFWKDRLSVFLGCNQRFAKSLGLSCPDEVIGKTDFDFLPAEAEAIFYRAEDVSVMESGEAKLRSEEMMTLANGKQRYIESYKAPMRDGANNIIGVVGMFQDITDRKQAELRLQQQSEQEHLLGSITQRMRSSLDLAEVLRTTVEDIHKVLQSDRVLVYRVFPDGTGAAIAESVSPNWSKILDVVFSEEIFPKENYERYVQGRIYTLSDRDDENQSVLPCLVEFLAEIQVRAKVVVPIIQNETLWGLLIAHQCDRPRHWQEWEINLLQQIANQLAIAIQQASLFEKAQIELAERQLAESRLTETNAQLAISNQELARATRLKDEFLANMSHELRTPLNAILGMTEGLQEEIFGSINKEQLQALQTVDRSGSHLLELIDDILDIAKIEAGQIELDCASTSVNHLCQSSIVFIKQQALQKKIQLDIQIQPNLPHVLVDERRIRQVLINLLNNAVKFTPEGGCITLKVTQLFGDHPSTPSPRECFLCIDVIDTGIGISSENIEKLFQPFIQIDNALNREYTGTGLGLALVKRIVELHGGNIELTSELGISSCFTVKLPFIATALPSVIADNKQEAKSEVGFLPVNEATSRLPLILLTEDNEANISTFSNYLQAKGYRILLAKDGQEAIDMAIIHQPDLILMDIQMPKMDGLEATKQIRLNPNLENIPIIALTALAMASDRDRCLQAGANEYLTKPVKLKALSNLIQTLLAF